MAALIAKLEAIDERLGKLEEDISETAAVTMVGDQAYDDEQMDEFREAFAAFDTTGSGSIESNELENALKLVGIFPKPEELQELLDGVDENSNGIIQFADFVVLAEKVDLMGNEEGGEGGGKKKKKKKTKTKTGTKLKKLSHYGRDSLLRWIMDDPDELEGDVTGPKVSKLRRQARRTMMNRHAENFVYFVIAMAAVISGIQTAPSLTHHIVIRVSETLILSIFTIEILIKMVAESSGKFYHFFKDGWNIFDFTILATLLIMTPFVDGEFDGLRILRLLRALRVLKATRVFPKLGLVVETMVHSVESVGYIALFMLVISYIFAIIGVSTFRINDPFHFGSLGVAILSLFRIATLEDWTDIMYFNMYGCDGWGDYAGATGDTDCGPLSTWPSACGCGSGVVGAMPEKHPYAAVIFFSAYVMISSFLMLNLFIGVITSAMAEAKDEMYKRKKEQARQAVAQRLKAKEKRKRSESEDAEANADGRIKLQNPIFEGEE